MRKARRSAGFQSWAPTGPAPVALLRVEQSPSGHPVPTLGARGLAYQLMCRSCRGRKNPRAKGSVLVCRLHRHEIGSKFLAGLS
jgi:hypothetical protein